MTKIAIALLLLSACGGDPSGPLLQDPGGDSGAPGDGPDSRDAAVVAPDARDDATGLLEARAQASPPGLRGRARRRDDARRGPPR